MTWGLDSTVGAWAVKLVNLGEQWISAAGGNWLSGERAPEDCHSPAKVSPNPFPKLKCINVD